MYPSDLTAQCLQFKPLLWRVRGDRHSGGRPRKYALRRIVDAMLYVVKTGCQLTSFLAVCLSAVPRIARQRPLGARRQDTARTGTQGEGSKRHAQHSLIDSQTAKTALKEGCAVNAGKKIKGRKRHIAVDTEGNLLAVIVHSAGIQDRVAARAVLMRLFCRFDRITKVFVDGGYAGKLIGWANENVPIRCGGG